MNGSHFDAADLRLKPTASGKLSTAWESNSTDEADDRARIRQSIVHAGCSNPVKHLTHSGVARHIKFRRGTTIPSLQLWVCSAIRDSA